jgi:hypothetical protein
MYTARRSRASAFSVVGVLNVLLVVAAAGPHAASLDSAMELLDAAITASGYKV